MTAPLIDLTVLCPTRNRPRDVDFLLGRLVPLLRRSRLSWEIVVSENAVSQERPTPTQRAAAAFDDERVRGVVHYPSYASGEENLFHALDSCRGEWVWTCADDDHPRDDAIEVLERLILDDAADLILCNAAIFDGDGRVTIPKALRREITRTALNPFDGDVVEFVRATGFMGFITTMSSTLFKRKAVAAVDWREHLRAGPIYAHASIYMEAFAGRRFLFIERPLVNFLRGADTETRWEVLARETARGLRYPWTLGTVRLLKLLQARDIISDGFLHEVIEANEVERFVLHGHVLLMVLDQIRLAIERDDPSDLYTPAEGLELLEAFTSGSGSTLALLTRALELNHAAAPCLRVMAARRDHLRPKSEDAALSGFMMTLHPREFERAISDLLETVLAELEKLTPRLPWHPPERDVSNNEHRTMAA